MLTLKSNSMHLTMKDNGTGVVLEDVSRKERWILDESTRYVSSEVRRFDNDSFRSERVAKRNSNVASALLQGLNGVSLQRTSTGKTVAMSSSGRCQMTVLIDGRRACPYNGCDAGPSPPSVAPGATSRRGRASVPPPPGDGQFVLLDNLLGVNEVAAVEVYPRGATIPPSLPSASDASCGLIAFWTGGRKPP